MAPRVPLALQLALLLLLGACGFVIGAETPESGVCSSASCEAADQGVEASFEEEAGEKDDSMSLLALRNAVEVDKRLLATNVAGFWYFLADAPVQHAPAPTSGTLFSFPGLLVEPPFTAGSGGIPNIPTGNYLHKVLTQGGGGTSYDDTLYAKMESQLGQYKAAGWDGVMWDWEVVGPGHTTSGFNKLMAATKAAGLINYLTTNAEGPYSWTAVDRDATGIDWTQVDFLVLKMYGWDGADFPDSDLQRYYNYWANGGGLSIQNTIFKAPPMSKFMWGLKVGTCSKASSWQSPSCVEWAYVSST